MCIQDVNYDAQSLGIRSALSTTQFIKNLLEMKQQQSAHDGPSQSLGQSDSPHKYSYNTLLSALPPETLAGITTEGEAMLPINGNSLV